MQRIPRAICRTALTLCLLATSISARADYVTRYDFSAGLAPWRTWMSVERASSPLRLRLPGAPDLNHLDGIGPIWLVAHLNVMEAGAPGLMDLRDAQLTIRLRTKEVDLQTFRLVWWLAPTVPPEATDPDMPQQHANWALTGSSIRAGSDWATVRVRLTSDRAYWTEAGTNIFQQGDWGRRYKSYPIDKALAEFTGTIHLVLVGTDADKPPSGIIEIDAIEIRKAPESQSPALSTAMSDLVSSGASEPARRQLQRHSKLADEQPSGIVEIDASESRKAPELQPPELSAVRDMVSSGAWEPARRHLQRHFELGLDDTYAHYLYGRALKFGLGGPVRYDEAARHLALAHDIHEARAELAELYLYGLGVTRNRATAIDLLRNAPEDPQANYLLALAHDHGIEVEQSSSEALAHFGMAAKQGHPQAMFSLGLRMLRTDPSVAYYWLRRAGTSLTAEVAGSVSEVIEHNIATALSRIEPEEAAEMDRWIDNLSVDPNSSDSPDDLAIISGAP